MKQLLLLFICVICSGCALPSSSVDKPSESVSTQLTQQLVRSGFSLDYPSGWQTVTHDFSGDDDMVRIYPIDDWRGEDDDSLYLQIDQYDVATFIAQASDASGGEALDRAKDHDSLDLKLFVDSLRSQYISLEYGVNPLEFVQIDSVSGYAFSYYPNRGLEISPGKGYNMKISMTYVIKGSDLYIIEYAGRTESDYDRYAPVVHTIIDSFRFDSAVQ